MIQVILKDWRNIHQFNAYFPNKELYFDGETWLDATIDPNRDTYFLIGANIHISRNFIERVFNSEDYKKKSRHFGDIIAEILWGWKT